MRYLDFYMQITEISLFLEFIWKNLYDAGWKVNFEENAVKKLEKSQKKNRISKFGAFRAARRSLHAAKTALPDLMTFALEVCAVNMV